MTIISAIGSIAIPCAVVAAIASMPAADSRDAPPDCDTRILGTWRQSESSSSPRRITVTGTCVGATHDVTVRVEGVCEGGDWPPADGYADGFLSSSGFSLRRSFQACERLVSTAMAVDGRNRLVVGFVFDDGRAGSISYRRAS